MTSTRSTRPLILVFIFLLAYDISDKRVLGRGAFSLVFKGKHRNTGAIVAVKAATIVPENPTGFHAELKANRVALGHPNVVVGLRSVLPLPTTCLSCPNYHPYLHVSSYLANRSIASKLRGAASINGIIVEYSHVCSVFSCLVSLLHCADVVPSQQCAFVDLTMMMMMMLTFCFLRFRFAPSIHCRRCWTASHLWRKLGSWCLRFANAAKCLK